MNNKTKKKSWERLFWERWQNSFIKRVVSTKKLPFHKLINPQRINTKIYQLAHKKTELFEHVLIQTNNICTRKCHFCWYGMKDVEIKNEVMPDWLFKKIIHELAEINYSGRVSLFEMNEPLSDSRLPDFIQYVKKNVPNSYQYIVTNGDLLTVEKATELINSGLDYLSVNAYSPVIYKRNRIIERKLSPNTWKNIDFRPLFNDKIATDNRAGNLDHIEKIKEPIKEPCSRVGHVLYIKPSGKAVSCFGDYFNVNVMGDANFESVTDIWFGEKFTRLRNSLNKGDRSISELCKKCNITSNCSFASREEIEENVGKSRVINGAIVGASGSAGLFFPELNQYSNVKYLFSQGGFEHKLFHQKGLIVKNEFEEVLADPDIDYVFIANQNKYHYQFAKQSLLAGKHVLVEKPMTCRMEELDELIEIGKKENLLVGGIFQFRFLETAKIIKKLIDQNKFGKLLFINARVLSHRNKEYFVRGRGSRDIDGGGVLIKLAIHGLDMVTSLFGEPVKWSAQVSNLNKFSETEDTALLSMKFKEGLGTLVATTSFRENSAMTIEVVGSEGRVIFDFNDNFISWEHKSLPEPKLNRNVNVYNSQIRNFIGAVGKKEQLIVTAEECRKSLSVILNVYKDIEYSEDPLVNKEDLLHIQ